MRKSLESFTEQNKNQLEGISDYGVQIIGRYKNIEATASSLLAFRDDWTCVQCIPDVRAACAPLLKEIKRDFPEFVPSILIDDVNAVPLNEVTVSGQNDNAVIPGSKSRGFSHKTVINEQEVQRKHQVKRKAMFGYDCRFRRSGLEVSTVNSIQNNEKNRSTVWLYPR